MDSRQDRTYIAIDLKSFYASAECVARGLDPLTTNLVVADASRTDKTICLAVSPSLKAYGIPGRARLFEVYQKLRGTDVEFIIAPPRMSYYIEVSSRIYSIYLRFIAPEDIHVYSIDEVFIDATQYLRLYSTTPHDLAMRLVREVLRETGITATAGIGPNLYLCKIAMDVEAKHQEPDKDGVRVAALDEESYRRKYWTHRPMTDFWRIGRGTVARLEKMCLYTLGDIARRSLSDEESLYREFGVNAELLIDHAWGWEPCTMAQIKSYRPSTSSLSSGQVLTRPYKFEEAALIVREMTDLLTLDLVEKRLVTDQLVLHVGYENGSPKGYSGAIVADWYGRPTPKPAHGSVNLEAAFKKSCNVTFGKLAYQLGLERLRRDGVHRPYHARGDGAFPPHRRSPSHGAAHLCRRLARPAAGTGRWPATGPFRRDARGPGEGTSPAGGHPGNPAQVRKERHPQGHEL